jgi:glycerol kinase
MGPRPDLVRVDGGLTGNELLMQMQADLLGIPVARHALREATACGAAICAGRGVGLLGATETSGFVRHDRVFEPVMSADAAASRLNLWRQQVQLT